MVIDLYRLARLMEESAILLEINGENKFKTKAYQDGADIIRRQTSWIAEASSATQLQQIDGIGKALSEKIMAYKETNRLPLHEEISKDVPESLLALAKLKGVGPKRTAQLWKTLDILDLAGLDAAIKSGELVKQKGFGPKTVASINKTLQYVKKRTGHVLLSAAIQIADVKAKQLLQLDEVQRISISGDISLANDTVSKVLLIVSIDSKSYEEQIKQLGNTNTEQYSTLIQQISKLLNPQLDNDQPNSDLLNNSVSAADIGISLRSTNKKPEIEILLVGDSNFHWVANLLSMDSDFKDAYLSYLKDTGWKIENGLPFKGGEKVSFSKTADVFDKPGLQVVPREIRSEAQTVHFAANGYLPELVGPDDIRGLVHMHTTWSDGKNTTREMAEAAMQQGMGYMLVTDHSQTAAYAGGLKPKDIILQHQEIDKLNEEYAGRFTILKGIESDILPDGSLDYPDEILASFDAVVGSIHGQFDLHPEAQTERLINALKNPYMHILGHSTGRLLLRRPGYEFDMHKVIDTAAEFGKIIEINSNPHRLDLPWEYIKDAKIKGVRFSINPDAHNTSGISHVEYGVKMARKGWLTKADIVNTLDSRGFLAALKRGPALTEG